MLPSTARELLLEMDNVLNERLQEIIRYEDALHNEIKRLESQIDRVDREVFRDFGGITWRIVYWIIIFGIPAFLFLLVLLGNAKH